MSHCYFSKETEALEKAAHSRPEIRRAGGGLISDVPKAFTAARGGSIQRDRRAEELGAPRSPRKRRQMPMPRQDMSGQLPMMKKGGSARKK